MTIATFSQKGNSLDFTPAAAVNAGQPVQLPDGRAAIPANDIAAGIQGAADVCGVFKVTKATGIVILSGAEVWFDRSAGEAVLKPAGGGSDRDFFLGVAIGDAASAATLVTIALNVRPQYIIDVHRDAGETVPVLTSGAPYLYGRGGTLQAGFSATAEAQKLDWLSKRSFPATSNWILEAIVEVVTNADADVADLNIGVANATHASDADTISESCFFHFDMGADLNLDAESDDGTTEVAATDTTIDWAVGTPLHLVIDGRDETDIQMYVNGVLVLSGTTFTLEDATGPLKALFHLEKTSNDSPGVVELDALNVRIME